tara:strand:+ start:1403 stop:2158 length:756 start_codon:yes stop_codon:yes gene_type:complete
MKNLYASIGYNGYKFQGFQSQPHGNTIQDHCRQICIDFFGQNGGLIGVSRTDAGVHALDQRIQFRVDSKIPIDKIARVMNSRLDGVRMHWVRQMPDEFEIRNISHKKTYDYELRCGPQQPIFDNYSWQLEKWPKSPEILAKILEEYVGEHDFILFSRKDPRRNLVSTVRTVDSVVVNEVESGHLRVSIRANGFLWYMVRYMLAYAISVWQELISLSELRAMLSGECRDRRNRPSIKPAPASGLYLRTCEII